MPKFTAEFTKKVCETYQKELSYKRTARKLKIDERAVKRIIENHRKETIQQVVVDQSGPAQQSRGVIVKVDSDHRSLTKTPQSSGSDSDPATKYKVIYRALMAGKKAPQIIAEYGFDPEFVEKQVRLFCPQQERDPLDFQSKILKILNNLDSREAKPYLAAFEQKGYLTNDQVIELIRKIGKTKAEVELINIFSLPDADPPRGWVKLRCRECGKSYAMVKSSDEIIQSFGKDWGQLWHLKCGAPL